MFETKWKHKNAGEFTHVFHVTKWIIARHKCLQRLDCIKANFFKGRSQKGISQFPREVQ